MVTYEMLTGLPPWYTTNREKLFQSIRTAPLKFPMSVNRTAALFIQVRWIDDGWIDVRVIVA